MGASPRRSAPPYIQSGRSGKEFPAFPPRDDMQNAIHLREPSHQSALRRRLGNSSAAIVMADGDKELAADFPIIVSQGLALGVRFPAGYTEDSEILPKYRALGLPTTVFINADGSIHTTWTGVLNEEKLIEKAGEMLDG